MLIDSNVLIYAINTSSPKHLVAQRFLQNQDGLEIAHQNVFETLRILTHPRFANPMPVATAIQAITAITKHSTVIFPTLETHEVALALINKYSISGSEIFDAYLVATALTNNVQKVATDNVKHLQKYQEIVVINPFV